MVHVGTVYAVQGDAIVDTTLLVGRLIMWDGG